MAFVQRRGAFILFEGIDRSGKTTQCSKLIDHLGSAQVRHAQEGDDFKLSTNFHA